MNYQITRSSNYTNFIAYNITEIKYERDFVLFFDSKGLNVAINSDTIIRIERT